MVKKAKGGGLFFPGKDAFQRMNFLYQASHLILARPKITGDLPAYYGSSMLTVAQKSVLKIEPYVKRDLCKGCGNLLKPGLSVKIRVRSGKLVCTCLRCGTIKRFHTKRGYKIWIERSDACLEEIETQDFTENHTSSAKPDEKEISSERSKPVEPICLKATDNITDSSSNFSTTQIGRAHV